MKPAPRFTIDLARPLIPHNPEEFKLVVTEIEKRGPRSFTVTILDIYGRQNVTEVWDIDCLQAFSKTLYNKKRQIAITSGCLNRLDSLVVPAEHKRSYVEDLGDLIAKKIEVIHHREAPVQEDVDVDGEVGVGLHIAAQNFNHLRSNRLA